MVNGVITMSGTGKELLANPQACSLSRGIDLEGGRPLLIASLTAHAESVSSGRQLDPSRPAPTAATAD
jgi:hypothetical protein